MIIVALKPGFYLLDKDTGPLGTQTKEKATEFDNYTDAGNALNRARSYETFPEAVFVGEPAE